MDLYEFLFNINEGLLNWGRRFVEVDGTFEKVNASFVEFLASKCDRSISIDDLE